MESTLLKVLIILIASFIPRVIGSCVETCFIFLLTLITRNTNMLIVGVGGKETVYLIYLCFTF